MNDVSLNPVHFFEIEANCHYLPEKKEGLMAKGDKYQLPSTDFLTGEIPFADLFLGWSEKGIFIEVVSSRPLDKAEFFLDTRDVKNTGGMTRFCHHFFFLPEKIEGKSAGEITRFRGEDKHELAKEEDLSIQGDRHKMKIFIPEHALFGYDPSQFKRIGFTSRLSSKERKQHFSCLGSEYPIELLPSLWGSLQLIG